MGGVGELAVEAPARPGGLPHHPGAADHRGWREAGTGSGRRTGGHGSGSAAPYRRLNRWFEWAKASNEP